jgi:hypothetical protein
VPGRDKHCNRVSDEEKKYYGTDEGWRRVLWQQRVRQRQARRLQPGRNLHPVDQRKAQTIDVNTRDMERADFSFELDFFGNTHTL